MQPENNQEVAGHLELKILQKRTERDPSNKNTRLNSGAFKGIELYLAVKIRHPPLKPPPHSFITNHNPN